MHPGTLRQVLRSLAQNWLRQAAGRGLVLMPGARATVSLLRSQGPPWLLVGVTANSLFFGEHDAHIQLG
jgi:hypothetical protein